MGVNKRDQVHSTVDAQVLEFLPNGLKPCRQFSLGRVVKELAAGVIGEEHWDDDHLVVGQVAEQKHVHVPQFVNQGQHLPEALVAVEGHALEAAGLGKLLLAEAHLVDLLQFCVLVVAVLLLHFLLLVVWVLLAVQVEEGFQRALHEQQAAGHNAQLGGRCIPAVAALSDEVRKELDFVGAGGEEVLLDVVVDLFVSDCLVLLLTSLGVLGLLDLHAQVLDADDVLLLLADEFALLESDGLLAD